MTKSASVRRILSEAPATPAQIAARLNWPRRTAEVIIWTMTANRQVEKVGHNHRVDRKPHSIYALTPRGGYWANRDRRKAQ